jgi:hypothetical protein
MCKPKLQALYVNEKFISGDVVGYSPIKYCPLDQPDCSSGFDPDFPEELKNSGCVLQIKSRDVFRPFQS